MSTQIQLTTKRIETVEEAMAQIVAILADAKTCGIVRRTLSHGQNHEYTINIKHRADGVGYSVEINSTSKTPKFQIVHFSRLK